MSSTDPPDAVNVNGKRLGRYRLLHKLGEGGMGEVYLAEDPRLERSVALKILPAKLAENPERRARFLREAKAAAKLNHPSITVIHDIGNADDRDYIAFEHVEGRTLEQVLAGRHLTLHELADLAVPLADALAYAHEKGVIHRDVKAANVIVTEHGMPKLLDFGLAKVLTEAEIDDAQKQKSTTLTLSGQIFGTPGAMSPEQALGRKVDARSDVFSFGSLLYEMASGGPAFAGTTVMETMDAVVHARPESLGSRRKDLPSEFLAIVEKALRKEPDERYQHMSDLAADLRHFKRTTDSDLVPPTTGRRRSSVPKALGVVGALAVVAVVVWIVRETWFSSGAGGASDGPLTLRQRQLTFAPGAENQPCLSPDGQTLVYTSGGDIYLRRVDGDRDLNLTDGCRAPDGQAAFSPDGNLIAFRSERDGGGIFVMGAMGESVRRLSDFGFHPAWSPDGKEIAVCTEQIRFATLRVSLSQIWALNAESGARRLVHAGDGVEPKWSPDGRWLVFWAAVDGQRDLWIMPPAGGEGRRLTDDLATDWCPVWSADRRHVYFNSDRGGTFNLWRLPMDADRGVATGPPQPVAASTSGYRRLSLSADGRRIAAATWATPTVSLTRYRLDVDAGTVSDRSSIPVGPNILCLGLSPDGKWAVGVARVSGMEDIYLVGVGSGEVRRLTNDSAKDRGPRWSPDGRQIFFYSNRGGSYDIWSIRPDGSGLTQESAFEGSIIGGLPSRNGDLLVFNLLTEKNRTMILRDRPEPVREVADELPRHRDGLFIGVGWSPDGNKILGGFLDTAAARVSGMIVYDRREKKYHRIVDRGTATFYLPACWLPDGKRCIMSAERKLWIVDTDTRQSLELASGLPEYQVQHVFLSSDARSLYVSGVQSAGDIWLLER